MSHSPPSSLLSFRGLICRGVGGVASSTPIVLYQLGGVPAGRCRPLRDQSLWFCLCGEHVQGKDGGDNPAHGIRLASVELGMRRTVRGLLFPFRKSHSSELQTRMQEVIILMVNFFSAEDRGATSGANLGLLSAGWSINTPLWTGFK